MLRIIVVSCLLSLCSMNTIAGVEVPSIFGDSMVLQRDKPVPVWGRAQPGRKIRVDLDGTSHFVLADDAGDWIVHLPPMKSSKVAKQLVIESLQTDGTVLERVSFDDVLVGEVWVCSGQSNMQ